MKKNKWLILEIFLVLVFLVLLFSFLGRQWEDRSYREDQEDWKSSFTWMEEDQVPEELDDQVHQENMSELQRHKAIYEEEVALIAIPGTGVFYPVFQTGNNEYYLDHNRDKAYHPFGEIFLDYRNNPFFTDRHSIIYGHNVKQAKTIFNELLNYQDQAYYESHQEIVVYQMEKPLTYTVVSVFYAAPDEDYLNLNLTESEDLIKFIGTYQERNLIQTNLPAFDQDAKLLTLSTCLNDDTRLVVQAVLVKDTTA